MPLGWALKPNLLNSTSVSVKSQSAGSQNSAPVTFDQSAVEMLRVYWCRRLYSLAVGTLHPSGLLPCWVEQVRRCRRCCRLPAGRGSRCVRVHRRPRVALRSAPGGGAIGEFCGLEVFCKPALLSNADDLIGVAIHGGVAGAQIGFFLGAGAQQEQGGRDGEKVGKEPCLHNAPFCGMLRNSLKCNCSGLPCVFLSLGLRRRGGGSVPWQSG